MRLLELTGIKHLKDKTPAEIIDYLSANEKTTLKHLGNGANGIAFTDGKTAYKFWHRDSAYEFFIKYVQDYQEYPCLPRLFSKVRNLPFNITSTDGTNVENGVKYIKMEILRPLSQDELNIKILTDEACEKLGVKSTINKLSINYAFDYPSRNKTIERGLMRVIESLFTHRFLDYDEEKMDINMNDASFFKMFDPAYLEIVKVTRDIVQFGNQYSFRADLHSSNFMVRPGTNQLVILDPIANDTDIDLNMELGAALR